MQKPVNGVMGRLGKEHKDKEVHAEMNAASGWVKWGNTEIPGAGIAIVQLRSDV